MIDCAAVMVLWSAWQPSTLATQVAVVVAHLVERLLPAPEVRGSNPVIGNFFCRTFVYCQLYYIEKTKIKKKRPGLAHFINMIEGSRGGKVSSMVALDTGYMRYSNLF